MDTKIVCAGPLGLPVYAVEGCEYATLAHDLVMSSAQASWSYRRMAAQLHVQACCWLSVGM